MKIKIYSMLGDNFEISGIYVAPSTAAARRVQFFLWRVDFSHLTADGLSLFNAASDWALGLDSSVDGDFGGDGDVDGSEFLSWQQGGSPNGASADDLAIWEANYGATNGNVVAINSVPEPGTALLLGFACAVVGLQQRRKK